MNTYNAAAIFGPPDPFNIVNEIFDAGQTAMIDSLAGPFGATPVDIHDAFIGNEAAYTFILSGDSPPPLRSWPPRWTPRASPNRLARCLSRQHWLHLAAFGLRQRQNTPASDARPASDGFVPIHRSLNEASSVVARTRLAADATMLFDGCNRLTALRRTTRYRNRCRPRWGGRAEPKARRCRSSSIYD